MNDKSEYPISIKCDESGLAFRGEYDPDSYRLVIDVSNKQIFSQVDVYDDDEKIGSMSTEVFLDALKAVFDR